VSTPPRLAVLAVLATGSAAFGAYYLWPSGRHLAACTPVHAPVPAAAQKLLATYAGRIRHEMRRPESGRRQESWADPLTGRSRTVYYDGGRLVFAYGIVPTSGAARAVWVDYRGRVWRSIPLRLPGTKVTALPTVTNGAAETAQANRDNVARGKASIVGKAVVDGRQTIQLRETIRPPRPRLPTGLPRNARIPRMPAFQLDIWVDPLTYVTLRTRTSFRGHSSVADETWLPRTPVNVDAARLIIPDGFGHEQERGSVSTSSFTLSARARCDQS
jgi:hypothetical protein